VDDEVALRAVAETDLELFFEHEHDPEAIARANLPPRDRDTFIAHWRTKVLGDPAVLVRTVTVGGAPAGNICAWWDDDDRRFIGYRFGRQYWGRGVGTRALLRFLEHEPARPLYADTFPANTASRRLLRRCGFQDAGTVERDGHDNVLLVLPAAQIP
jgi:RimJ/RimL family protein N-acetyltransferase